MLPKKKFKYNESFVQFGFIVINTDGEEKPQCVLRHKVLASSSLKPCKLKRHLETHHPNSTNKGSDFFKRHGQNLENARLDSTGKFFKENTAALKASYEVAREIAVAKKPHSIGEQLIMQSCKIIMSNLLSNSEVEKLKQVSVSNNTVSRRIAELSNNIVSRVVSKIQISKYFFAIQLDKTTDVANLAQLCVYVRYSTFMKNIWKMNSCFAKVLTQKQRQKTYLTKLIVFLRSTISNGSMLVAFAPMVLLQCLVVALVFKLW